MDEIFWAERITDNDLEQVPVQDGSFMEIGNEEETTAVSEHNSCGICAKVFGNPKNLRRHLLVHMDIPKCKSCKKSFESEEELQEHKTQKHSKKFVCDQCGASYERKQSLKRHGVIKHSSNDYHPLKCPFQDCAKVFAVMALYEDHIHHHTKAKPHICRSCTKSFSSRYARNEHCKICESSEKYVCKQCSSKFSTRGSLFNHEEGEHKNELFKCICGETYKYRPNLIRHKKKCVY